MNESYVKVAQERLEALSETLIDKKLSYIDEKLNTYTKILNSQENELLSLKVDVIDKMKDLSSEERHN